MKGLAEKIAAPVKAPLRKLKNSVVEHKKGFSFDRALRRFARTQNASLIPQLVDGWHNTQWSALDEYLLGCIGEVRAARGDILECGSGLSTLLLGIVAQSSGARLCTLEHSQAWADKVQFYLQRFRIESVRIFCKPLRSYGDFEWYDPPLELLPRKFALTVCDGPPASTTQGGRYGLLPVMGSRLSGSIILLDDAQRPEEQAIARRWSAECGGSCSLEAIDKPYLRISIPAE
jgi:hypothetical protein